MLISHRYSQVFRTAARGLEAQRIALSTTAENIANATTTRTADGTPYRVKRTVHEVEDRRYDQFGQLLHDTQMELQTNHGGHMDELSLFERLPEADLGPITAIEEQDQQPRLEFDPTHPHARPDGYVEYPDINVVEEMARMVSANRIYEANLSVVQAAKDMMKRTIDL